MFDVTRLTKPDYDKLMEDGNLTEYERGILELRNQKVTNEVCAEMLNISTSTVNRTIRRLREKAVRLGIINVCLLVFGII